MLSSLTTFSEYFLVKGVSVLSPDLAHSPARSMSEILGEHLLLSRTMSGSLQELDPPCPPPILRPLRPVAAALRGNGEGRQASLSVSEPPELRAGPQPLSSESNKGSPCVHFC